ncbi:MAG: helix-turn-helix domain-containing protein [Pseudomonadota bacterium]
MRVKAVILEGQPTAEAMAAIRAALAAQGETVVFAPPSIGEIIGRVAWETGLRRAEIVGRSREARLFRARCAVTLLARRMTGYSTGQIGQAMGKRDHTTILHQIDRAAAFEARDPAFAALVARVAKFLEHGGIT